MMLTVGEHVLGGVKPRVLRMVSLLTGGVAGTRQEMCGALSGAVLILGALYGRSNLSEDEQLARKLAVRYRGLFLAEFGVTQCARMREHHQISERSGTCASMLERVAAILLEALSERERLGEGPPTKARLC